MLAFSVVITFTIASLVQARTYYPQTPEYLRCRYGKYYKNVGQPPSCNPFGQSCPPPYFCSAGPADEPGYCCKTENPCKAGNPYTRNGDAPNCLGINAVSCPRGYTCVGSRTSYSVCCKGCTYRGESYFPSATFYNSEGQQCTCGQDGQVSCTYPVICHYKGQVYNSGQTFKDDCNTCTCGSNGSVVCTKIGCQKYCYYNGQRYSPGQQFPARDGCNTCTCESTGGVSCTEIGCNPGGYVG